MDSLCSAMQPWTPPAPAPASAPLPPSAPPQHRRSFCSRCGALEMAALESTVGFEMGCCRRRKSSQKSSSEPSEFSSRFGRAAAGADWESTPERSSPNVSGSFEDELKETDETLTEEFTCTVTLMFLFVVDSYLEGVLCAACRRCVELFKFNTESTTLGYGRGAEMARLVPLGRSTQ